LGRRGQRRWTAARCCPFRRSSRNPGKHRAFNQLAGRGAEVYAAAQAVGDDRQAWIARTARKEFVTRVGLETVSQYEAEYGPFTPAEIAEANE
jgi:hypothetical protein